MEDGEEEGHVSEEFLSCPICTEEYNDPRSLPCLHTFCLNCIADHIDSNTKGVHVPKGFDCPKCHQFVDSPNVLQGKLDTLYNFDKKFTNTDLIIPLIALCIAIHVRHKLSFLKFVL